MYLEKIASKTDDREYGGGGGERGRCRRRKLVYSTGALLKGMANVFKAFSLSIPVLSKI